MNEVLDKKLPLRKSKPMPYGFDEPLHWKSSLPFVENDRAILVHRPRSISTHKNGNRAAHTAIHMFCGALTFNKKSVRFSDVPPIDSLLCPRCEKLAVEFGLPSAESLAGRHVHTGKVIGIKICCKDKS